MLSKERYRGMGRVQNGITFLENSLGALKLHTLRTAHRFQLYKHATHTHTNTYISHIGPFRDSYFHGNWESGN